VPASVETNGHLGRPIIVFLVPLAT
jgi:hypothetical protein